MRSGACRTTTIAALFELLILEGAQAGLSWSTILNKREHYRKVFDSFDARKVAATRDARWRRCWRMPGSCAIA